MTKFEKAVADWPKTRVIMVKDGVGVHITGRYMHPGLGDSILHTYVLVGIALGIFATIASANPFPGVVLGGFMWVLYSIFRDGMVNSFGKKVDFKMFADKIEVRNGFWYKKYSRAVPMEFRIEPHHKGAWETAKEIRLGRRVKVRYRNAIEVVMQYGEKRVPVAEFEATDIERAKALLFRIQTAVVKMNYAMQETAKAAERGEFGPEPNVS